MPRHRANLAALRRDQLPLACVLGRVCAAAAASALAGWRGVQALQRDEARQTGRVAAAARERLEGGAPAVRLQRADGVHVRLRAPRAVTAAAIVRTQRAARRRHPLERLDAGEHGCNPHRAERAERAAASQRAQVRGRREAADAVVIAIAVASGRGICGVLGRARSASAAAATRRVVCRSKGKRAVFDDDARVVAQRRLHVHRRTCINRRRRA
mmetsp:Transcript_26148/g.77583  ORF Transcript_26148/g.77583 Transcript_26148/m.77583 type:complete len:213 (+) Transcript_26148:122-760(+)